MGTGEGAENLMRSNQSKKENPGRFRCELNYYIHFHPSKQTDFAFATWGFGVLGFWDFVAWF